MAEINAMFIAAHRFALTSYTIRVRFTAGIWETITITVSTSIDYYMQGDGSATDLLKILQDRLNTNGQSRVFTVAYVAASQRVIISATGGNFQIEWDDALTTIDKRLYGFTGTLPAALGTTTTAPYGPKSVWFPNWPVSRTNYGDPEIVSAIERTISGRTITAKLSHDVDFWRMTWMLLDQAVIKNRWATADAYNCLEWFFENYLTLGRTFRLVEDVAVKGTYTALRLIDHALPWRLEDERLLTSYAVELRAREVA